MATVNITADDELIKIEVDDEVNRFPPGIEASVKNIGNVINIITNVVPLITFNFNDDITVNGDVLDQGSTDVDAFCDYLTTLFPNANTGSGGSGLTAVIHDFTLTGDGTSDEPLSVVALSSQNNITWSVLDILNAPPSSPTTGDKYLVGTSPTGAWAADANDIAEWNGSSWDFSTADEGDFLNNNDENFSGDAGNYQNNGATWDFVGKSFLYVGGNTENFNLRVGTIANKALVFITNNLQRLIIAANGAITHKNLIGTGNAFIKVDANGVESRSAFDGLGFEVSATFSAINASTQPRMVRVTADETNNGDKSLYLHNGTTLEFLQTIA